MAGSVDPPDGTPDGTPEGRPGGGEDEYRSVVFDESFIRAARLRELSAQERLDDQTHQPVRPRLTPGGQSAADPGPAPERHRPRHASRTGALALVLVVAMVFAVTVHLASRAPDGPPPTRRAEPARVTLVALAPLGPVPGGTPADLYARSPAARHRTGAAGISPPPARRTAHFTSSQVLAALSIAKDYLVQSSLDPDVLRGATVRRVRLLLDPDLLAQFDRSADSPAADGRHATGGWLIRLDPAHAALADPAIRVNGALRVTETSPGALEVTSDHTFTYALRPANPAPAPKSGPAPGPGSSPAPGPGSIPIAVSGTDSGSVPASDAGPGTVSVPGSGPDSGGSPAPGPVAAPGAGPGPASEPASGGPGSGSGPAPGHGPGSSPGPATDAGASAEARSGAGSADASLFTVRRELRFRFDRDDLRLHRAELVTSHLWAGPMDCAADLAGALRPLLAGRRATTTTAPSTDPYAPGPVASAPLCAPLATGARPAVPQPSAPQSTTSRPGVPRSASLLRQRAQNSALPQPGVPPPAPQQSSGSRPAGPPKPG
ncbi:hypothetical protein [Streptomyces sp. MUM 203J]|uniref:SCO2583 family membrane protein n=1 Tax=Streptomyces sp. MUM 203J TaxID=2791990 RepID=UPI001F0381F8|nr:hypothetical protein [Streptomyces sp. MUM 203J]